MFFQRPLNTFLRSARLQVRQTKRNVNGYFGYRELPRIPHLKQERRTAHILGTMFWFSALMTAYIEPDKIYVSRCFPYAQEFTDPELGIPSDDQGLAPVKENPKNYKTRSLIRPQNFPPTIVKSYYGVTPYEG